MSESPFMPQQPNQVKAPLLVGTVLLGIGIFLVSYVKWESILISLGLTAASTGLLYFLLKGFLLKRTQPRYGNRDIDPKRRRK